MVNEPSDDLTWSSILDSIARLEAASTDEQSAKMRGLLEEALKELGIELPLPEFADEVFQLRDVLGGESDRGCALMGAAFLDARLEGLLKERLVDDPNVAGALLGGSGGLATFSSRIDASYLVGIFGPAARRDLHLIRKIRNEFAHCAENIDFGHGPIADRCNELGHDVYGDDLAPRKKFMRSCLGILGVIDGAGMTMSRIDVGPDAQADDPEKQAKANEVRDMLDDLLDGKGAV